MFVLKSDITVGKFNFSGVNEVRIQRSLHNFADTAIIKIPKIGRVLKGKVVKEVKIGELFSDGEVVTIKLGYGDDMQTEFEGFVKRRNVDMPMEIECEGYVRQMREKVDVTDSYQKTSAKELLSLISAETDIEVVVVDDLPLVQIELIHANGIDICNKIKELSQGALSVFFIEPRKLWCGLTYTPYAAGSDPFGNGTVNYKLGYNCIKDNGLKERFPDEPVQIVVGGTDISGHRIEGKGDTTTITRVEKKVFNNVTDKGVMVKMANELQYQKNYYGYEGHITGFLQPFCRPGFKANIIDPNYDNRDGKYMVESTSVTFGISGARREVELGPVIGFNKSK